MSMRVIISNNHSFTPEEWNILIATFEETLRALGLANREDPVTTLVAQKIIKLAKQGERDPIRLHLSVLASLGLDGD